MSKVLIYVDGMVLDRIKTYCNEKKVSMSKVFVRGALSIVNSQPIEKCSYCHNPSMGKYTILVNDWEQGEVKTIKALCAIHLKKAQSESEVIEI